MCMSKKKKRWIIVGAILTCAILLNIAVILLIQNAIPKSENITFVGENEQRCLLYQGTEYNLSPICFVTYNTHVGHENDIKVGYYYSFPFGTAYYSDVKDNPDYIYSVEHGHKVYIKNGYDYTSKEFVINDTSKTIIFSQVVTGESLGQNISDNISNEISATLYSKEHPDLKIPLNVFSENGEWYAVFRNNEVYPISQEFVNLLK